MTATLEVARDLDGPALLTVPLALKRADDSRVAASGAVPVGALSPGDYVVRGVIRLEDGTTGRVMRTLRTVAPRTSHLAPRYCAPAQSFRSAAIG